LKGSFGKPDDETNCQEREVIYDDVIYDEKMQCRKVVEKKCFQVQETTFNIYKVSILAHTLIFILFRLEFVIFHILLIKEKISKSKFYKQFPSEVKLIDDGLKN